MTKKKIIILISISFCLILVLVVLIKNPFRQQNPNRVAKVPTRTVAQTQKDQKPAVIVYDQSSKNRMIDILQMRPALSPKDQAVKADLTKISSPLYITDSITIKYYPVSDLFETEINTIRVNTAKKETMAWFLRQGLSISGMCKLPVTFYLNEDRVKTLRGLNIVFNPLPPGC